MRPVLVVPLVLAGLAAFAATRAPVSDSDFFWHLAIGRDIAAHGVPRVDVYSWTVAGRAVLPDQWLGELLLYAAYAIGSWGGTIALRALTVGALIGVVVWTTLAERPTRPFIAVLASLLRTPRRRDLTSRCRASRGRIAPSCSAFCASRS